MALKFPSQSNESLLAWGRAHAHKANLQLVDSSYDEETFTFKFVVPLYEDATEADLYRLRASAFFSDYLSAPWTVGKIARRVNDTTKLVIYSLPLIPSTQSD